MKKTKKPLVGPAKPVKRLNPFGVHVNNQKFKILGRQLKTDRGLPGVSRAKAIKKRKETLLEEYKVLNKSNKFIDNRIGENVRHMTEEDKVLARFTAERMSAHKRKAMYNLGDDEPLTHRGRSLAEMESYDDPRSDDDDVVEAQALDKNFTEEAHFGGGTLTKKDSADGRMAVIDKLIAESKARKALKAENKEKNLIATEKLDQDWKDLMPILSSTKPEDDPIQEKKDSYDVLLGELRFEPRGTPSDRLMSENEIAEKESNELRRLEEERLKRMRGDEENVVEAPKKSHRSADDLDDGFDLQENEKPFVLMYDKEGRPINFPDSSDKNEKPTENVESSSEEEDSEEEGSDGEEEGPDDLSDMRVVEDDEDDKEESADTEIPNPKRRVVFKDEVETVNFVTEREDKTLEYLEKERAKFTSTELPFTFTLPETYEEFSDIFKDRSYSDCAVITERMIKCNHPSLKEGNILKLDRLFAFLLQVLDDASDSTDVWPLLDNLSSCFFDLCQFSPNNASYCFKEVLIEKEGEFVKRKSRYPGPDTLVFLKLAPLLFPASDKKHLVTTPCFGFMMGILRGAKPTNRRAIATGLFLSSLLYQYVHLSKRIVPEVLVFLNGIISMATPPEHRSLVSPPFTTQQRFLYLQSDLKQSECGKMLGKDLLPRVDKIDDDFRLRALSSGLQLCLLYAKLYKEHQAAHLLFSHIFANLEGLKTQNYPPSVENQKQLVLDLLKELKEKPLEPLIREKRKPKILRTYEPSFAPVYDRRGWRKPRDETEVRKELVRKVKREAKGAMREIRRDRSFLASVKYKEILANDAERKRKVKEIYTWGAQQQAELNNLDRKNRTKKF